MSDLKGKGGDRYGAHRRASAPVLPRDLPRAGRRRGGELCFQPRRAPIAVVAEITSSGGKAIAVSGRCVRAPADVKRLFEQNQGFVRQASTSW